MLVGAVMNQLSLFAEASVSIPQYKDETWRVIGGFTDYEVSSMGRFRQRRSYRVLNGTVANNGYIHIGLMRHGRQVWKLTVVGYFENSSTNLRFRLDNSYQIGIVTLWNKNLIK
jgi:hypothetical protein